MALMKKGKGKKKQVGKKGQKRSNKRLGERIPTKKRKTAADDEEIESESDSDVGNLSDTDAPVGAEGGSSNERQKTQEELEEEMETPQEKRLRIAKKYLATFDEEELVRQDNADVDLDAIAHRIRGEGFDRTKQVYRAVAASLEGFGDPKVIRCHRGVPTQVVVSSDGKFVYSGSKDGSIVKSCVATGKKLIVVPGIPKKQAENETKNGHSGDILALALSSDDRFLASGCTHSKIHIWKAPTMEHAYMFIGHRKPVTSLAFRERSYDLYSGSVDRLVKVWNAEEFAYVETVFGHEDHVSDLDCMAKERCVTAGGRDRTLRVWKFSDESQLVYLTKSDSVERVRMLSEEKFVAGTNDGSLLLYQINKRMPMLTKSVIHGYIEQPKCPGVEGLPKAPRWISAIGTFKGTDLIATGSWDGFVRVWKVSQDLKSCDELFAIPVPGFVNRLEFSNNGSFLAAAVGQEHARGRWWKISEAKNAVYIIPLKFRGMFK